ncbi:DctP family TRAP transporter solute-binding subunit [Oceanobacillus massiliensis]|uniref:TRAP transporter substrate-binding protein n=1 Tax=Oceanobacillus massiliensis TaxID=1465765 RepID=UPI000288C753|nr:DctP family TRAP transporter solute-binding subunit [Oceanobacillus massiliensis]
MKINRIVMASGMALLLLVLAACSGTDSGGAAGDTVTLKLAHTGSETHQYQIAAEKFKELVEEKTDGSIEVEIHGNSTLGSEASAVEQVMDGSIEMTTVSADSSFANTVPEMNVFGLPYLFEDRDHVYRTLDGDIGQELLDLTESQNMKGLGYWEVGFRHITNSTKEITTPEDVKGLQIRVQPSPVWESHMKAIGASPTPVDFNELYSAMDQGVVDGQENPLPTIDSMKFYEVQKYVSLTSHTYSPAIVVMNNDVWNGLDEEQQTAVQEAVDETTTYHREALAEKEEEILKTLEENDVIITEPDREAFREATKDVKNEVKEVPADLIERIENN